MSASQLDSKRQKQEDSAAEITNRVGRPLHLRFLGLCGVDESFANESDYAWPSYVEWGVLFRPEKEGTLRFPKDDWVRRFVVGKPHLAAHLCSTRCLEFLQGDMTFIQRLHKEFGFRRFQINATKANNFDSDSLNDEHVNNIIKAAKAMPSAEFIVQRNDETKMIWKSMEMLKAAKPPNISYLFDASVGRGVVVSEFSRPHFEEAPYGYAGGLKPENVEQVLKSIAQVVPSGVSIWVDMESGIRNKDDDTFNASRAWAVCEIVEKLINEGLIEIKDV